MVSFNSLVGMLLDRPKPDDAPRGDPRAEVGPARPMVGVLGRLSSEQRARAFSYTGPEAVGDEAFRLKP